MTRIYTKTGDDGSTARLYGGRVSKSDPLVEACGDIDETVAALGAARAAHVDDSLGRLLLHLQRDLFVVAADLAANPRRRDRLVDGTSRVTAGMVDDVEQTIDRLVTEQPLRPVFVVPGSTRTEAALDLARAVARRAERHVVAARSAGRTVSDLVAQYLNRLSDLLFVLGRHASDSEEPVSHPPHGGAQRRR